MNQVKTGKFIADERRRKNYTQRQLADFLEISDKTVSKWECGNGFPEISLLLPLCETLDISVNELLSGERLSEIEYRQEAEKNMIHFLEEKVENKKKMGLVIIIAVISAVASITLIKIVDIYSEYMNMGSKIIISAIAYSILLVGIYVAAKGERTIGYYYCTNCREKFVPSVGAYMTALHIGTDRWLKCPKCGKRYLCKKTLSKND